MTSRVVRAKELDRVLDVLAKRGLVPAAFDLMPGGLVRLHRQPPGAVATDRAEEEARAWDAALG